MWEKGNAIVKRALKLIQAGVALAALSAGASSAAQPVPTISPISSAASSVAAAYDTYHIKPLWLRNGPSDPAAAQLVSILQRAPFDGFAEGPQLAAQAQAAVAQAASGDPASLAAAERTLSTAWVEYVQALKRPTNGMIYAFQVLRPQGSRADQILLTAAAAPSLPQYLSNTSNVNPIYAQLRDAAWANAQAMGNLTPDPRLLANLDRVRSLPANGRFLLGVHSLQLILQLRDLRRRDLRREARARTGFVDHVDRLVGQKPIGDVAL